LGTQRAATRRNTPALIDELALLQARAEAIGRLGPAEPALHSVALVLARVLDVLRQGDARFGVRLGVLSLPGRNGALSDGPPDAQALAMLAKPLRGLPGARIVRLDVRATYRSYSGLKEWMAELGVLPVSFQRVWLEEQQVQFSLHVMGV
jgi:hypothetical protein